MIPRPIPPLTALSILVTRPATQAKSLGARIASLGGEAVAFPVMSIEPLSATASADRYDWLIFVSVNAVQHGLGTVPLEGARIAAIGNATATALQNANKPADIVAPPPHTSESLLAAPELSSVAGKRIAIVRGMGGRDALRAELSQRGATVEYLDVYRRVPAVPSGNDVSLLEERWQNGVIDVVTVTSVEILDCLLSLLTEKGRALLRHTAFVAPSERIVAAARAHGLTGNGILARAADDDSLTGAIAQWHARAKSMTP